MQYDSSIPLSFTDKALIGQEFTIVTEVGIRDYTSSYVPVQQTFKQAFTFADPCATTQQAYVG